jgi:hypothetical protein
MRALGQALSLLAVVALLAVSSPARAEVRVPVQLQAQLSAKIAAFDRNFGARAGATAKVLVVQKAGNDESAHTATLFVAALQALGQVGGVKAEIEVVTFHSAAAIAERCRSGHVALAYFSAGLETEMGGIAQALAGVDILTIGASAVHAERGAVVGFDLEDSKPKMVVNLASAKAQKVELKAELLRMARVCGTSR